MIGYRLSVPQGPRLVVSERQLVVPIVDLRQPAACHLSLQRSTRCQCSTENPEESGDKKAKKVDEPVPTADQQQQEEEVNNSPVAKGQVEESKGIGESESQKDDKTKVPLLRYRKIRYNSVRPAWKNSPFDSPLRDGNRDAIFGLLTTRAARTLLHYLSEINVSHYSWFLQFIRDNPIPQKGNWQDVSGDSFVRALLSCPTQDSTYSVGRDEMFDNFTPIGVDPRDMAVRLLEIRSALAREFIKDLQLIQEENSRMLKEALAANLALDSLEAAAAPGVTPHPEMEGEMMARRRPSYQGTNYLQNEFRAQSTMPTWRKPRPIKKMPPIEGPLWPEYSQK